MRDNAVAALAILHDALRIDPALAILHDALRIDPETLHFHRQCLRDAHQCPGKNVSQGDMIARVKTQLAKERAS